MTKSDYHNARSNRCFVPAPSFCSGAGEWMWTVRQFPGKGNVKGSGQDRAAEPGESVDAREGRRQKAENRKHRVRPFRLLPSAFCIHDGGTACRA